MTEPHWDSFEWDDETKKNGNVQHLRDHDIEPDEAEECFFHDYIFAADTRRFDDVYVLDGRTDRGRNLRLVFQDKRNGLARIFSGWMLKSSKKKKEMKRQFAKLSKAEQQEVESDYHRMKSEEFDEVMSRAEPHSPNAIRLSPRLVKRLKTVAKSEGEPEYQAMVQRWVEERLQQTVKRAATSTQNRSR